MSKQASKEKKISKQISNKTNKQINKQTHKKIIELIEMINAYSCHSITVANFNISFALEQLLDALNMSKERNIGK